MGEPIILSHYQVEPLLSARLSGQTSIVTSLDLGLSTNEVQLDAERVVLSGREWLSWESITEIAQIKAQVDALSASETEKVKAAIDSDGSWLEQVIKNSVQRRTEPVEDAGPMEEKGNPDDTFTRMFGGLQR